MQSFSHTPVPAHTSVHPERQSLSAHVPGPEQVMVQPPPSQVSSVAPAPVLRLEQPPSGQWKVHEPVPEHEKSHPLAGRRGSGTHVSSHASVPVQAQGVPGAHSRGPGFSAGTALLQSTSADPRARARQRP